MTDRITSHEQEIYEKLRHLAGTGDEERLAAAWRAYQDARTDGLCFAGAWEIALAALHTNQATVDSGE
jgi:hypothetical protein